MYKRQGAGGEGDADMSKTGCLRTGTSRVPNTTQYDSLDAKQGFAFFVLVVLMNSINQIGAAPHLQPLSPRIRVTLDPIVIFSSEFAGGGELGLWLMSVRFNLVEQYLAKAGSSGRLASVQVDVWQAGNARRTQSCQAQLGKTTGAYRRLRRRLPTYLLTHRFVARDVSDLG